MNLIFDIETVREYFDLSEAPAQYQEAWKYVAKKRFPDQDFRESYIDNAALFPEFGKIVAIAFTEQGEGLFKDDPIVQSFAGEYEDEEVICRFGEYLEKKRVTLIGHAIKFFDIPFVVARFAKHRREIPFAFRMFGVKPWEMNVIDTADVWKCGFYSTANAASLIAISNLLGIASPKEKMTGGDVGEIYYHHDQNGFDFLEDAIDAIREYCEADVRATAEVFAKMKAVKML